MFKGDELMHDIDTVLNKFDLTSQDQTAIIKAGETIIPSIDKHLDRFYAWMANHDEYTDFFGDDEVLLKRVRKMQVGYWETFFSADITPEWVEQRRHVGEVHANIGLPNDIYFAGISFSATSIAKEIHAFEKNDAIAHQQVNAFQKLVFLDSFIVIEEISRIQREKLSANAREIVEMSTPVTPIWDGVLLLPLLGFIDSYRSKEIMRRTLDAISKYRASILLLDISGVSVMDTAVSNELFKIARATRFMGCETIISGLSPTIAQTMVDLGVDTGTLKTKATLEDSFRYALETLRYSVVAYRDQ
jgi:rsbT co-antagonist protein RsbR